MEKQKRQVKIVYEGMAGTTETHILDVEKRVEARMRIIRLLQARIGEKEIELCNHKGTVWVSISVPGFKASGVMMAVPESVVIILMDDGTTKMVMEFDDRNDVLFFGED